MTPAERNALIARFFDEVVVPAVAAAVMPNIPKPIDPLDDPRPYTDMELYVRTYNCLHRYSERLGRPVTIGELRRESPAEFLKIKNFGRKSLQNLQEALREA